MSIVGIAHTVCVAVAYKIQLKCDYSNEAYSSIHKIQYIHKGYIAVLGILIPQSGPYIQSSYMFFVLMKWVPMLKLCCGR